MDLNLYTIYIPSEQYPTIFAVGLPEIGSNMRADDQSHGHRNSLSRVSQGRKKRSLKGNYKIQALVRQKDNHNGSICKSGIHNGILALIN